MNGRLAEPSEHGAGRDRPLYFGRYVNSIPIGGGADYAHNYLLAPPDFKTYLQQEITIG